MYAIEKLDPAYKQETMRDVFFDAAYIVHNQRPWFRRQLLKYPLHPIVEAAIKLCRPYDWQQLLLEWPHRSDNDENIVAFTRDERGGEADRVVTTSMGKYLGRHFPMPDHYIRDLVALHTLGQEQLLFVHTIDQMLHHLNNGPHSCMRKPNEDPAQHPYQAYAPEYGWHMAVRIEQDGMTCGRALCYEDPKTKEKFFVRSYNRDRSGGYSHSDNKLEAWLKQQGYEHRNSWYGCKLKWVDSYHNLFLAPYLDGDTHYVSEEYDSDKQCHYLLVVDSESEAGWVLNNTDGTPSEVDPGTPCEDCSDHISDGDGYWVGRREDRFVCYSCRSNDYTYALTRNGDRAYIHNDDVVYIDSQDDDYDVNYLSDNSIVCLENGDYEHIDNAIEVDGDWYAADDERIVQLVNGDYALVGDCVEINNQWYHKDDDDIVQIDGSWYTKDEDAVVECDDGEYRLKDDCFQCPACDAWHARELIEA